MHCVCLSDMARRVVLLLFLLAWSRRAEAVAQRCDSHRLQNRSNTLSCVNHDEGLIFVVGSSRQPTSIRQGSSEYVDELSKLEDEYGALHGRGEDVQCGAVANGYCFSGDETYSEEDDEIFEMDIDDADYETAAEDFDEIGSLYDILDEEIEVLGFEYDESFLFHDDHEVYDSADEYESNENPESASNADAAFHDPYLPWPHNLIPYINRFDE